MITSPTRLQCAAAAAHPPLRTQPAALRTQPAALRTQPAGLRTQPAAPCTQPLPLTRSGSALRVTAAWLCPHACPASATSARRACGTDRSATASRAPAPWATRCAPPRCNPRCNPDCNPGCSPPRSPGPQPAACDRSVLRLYTRAACVPPVCRAGLCQRARECGRRHL